MRTLNGLAARNLGQHRTRTILSALAVALGVAMTIAANVIRQAIQNTVTGPDTAQEVQTIASWMVDSMGVMLDAIGLVILLVAGFLVFNAFAMSINQRRRQIGMLRSLGMTRGQVMRTSLMEALITGALGTAAGVVFGPLLGFGIVAFIGAVTANFFTFSGGSASLESIVVAATLGIGITVLSVLVPARNATRIPPLAALRETDASGVDTLPVRWAVVGLVGAIALLVYLVIDTPGEWIQAPQDIQLSGLLVLLWLICWVLVIPVFIGKLGDWTRGIFSRRWGATGRLISDNLQRGRRRVLLTILTLAVGLTMIVGLTGFITYMMTELFAATTANGAEQDLRLIMPFDMAEGMSAYTGNALESLQLPSELIAEVEEAVAGNGRVMENYFVMVPELSFLIPNFFSYVMDPYDIQLTGNAFFTFSEGDWETAMPIMEAGCGLLVTPMVAAQNDAGLGDVVTVTGINGPVDCTIAGIGSGYVNASIISIAVGDEFGIENPIALGVAPFVGADEEALDAAILEVIERYDNAHLTTIGTMATIQQDAGAMVVPMFNGMLLLAVLAAALGIVNTTVMSVNERRRELGLLRAVGSTRGQTRRVVLGEAALMGFVGGLVGLIAGVGITVIFIVTYGSNAWGLDLDLWAAVGRVLPPALITGIVGLIASPIISAWAAWFPSRSILRGTAIETLQGDR